MLDKVKNVLTVAYAPVGVMVAEECEKNKAALKKSWKPIKSQIPYHIQFLLSCLFMVCLPMYFMTQKWPDLKEFQTYKSCNGNGHIAQ